MKVSGAFLALFFKAELDCAAVLTYIPCILHLYWCTENFLLDTEIFCFAYHGLSMFHHNSRFFPALP